MKKFKSTSLAVLLSLSIGLLSVGCSDDEMDDLKVISIEDASYSDGSGGTGNSGAGGGTNPPPAQ